MLNALEKSTNNSLADVPGLSRCWYTCCNIVMLLTYQGVGTQDVTQ